MKVIKGRKQKGWAQQFLCTGKGNGDGGCEAVLLVEEDDIHATSSSYLFKCCECGVETDLSDIEVPARVRNKMTTRNRAGGTKKGDHIWVVRGGRDGVLRGFSSQEEAEGYIEAGKKSGAEGADSEQVEVCVMRGREQRQRKEQDESD